MRDLEESFDFYSNKLSLQEVRRMENDKSRFTPVFLAEPDDVERARQDKVPQVELTYNWGSEDYTTCRLFGYHGLTNGEKAFSFDHMFGF